MKILFIQSAPPHGSLRGQEGLDALLMGSAFAECTALFMGNSVLQLVSQQEPGGIHRKDFAKTLGALKDYGVSRIYCEQSACDRYKLSLQDFVIPAETADATVIRSLLSEHEQVLSF